MTNKIRAQRVHLKIRSKSDRPRLLVHRSSKYIYAQIDNQAGQTLASVSDKSAKIVGEKIAAAAKQHKISEVVFDRGSYKYHGQVRQLAEAAREAGLKF